MRKNIFTLMAAMAFPFLLGAQSYGFESGVSPAVLVSGTTGSLTTVSAPFKEGSKSLQWNWTAPAELLLDVSVNNGNYRDGVIFWVYNEVPATKPLKCEYRDTSGKVQYYFSFNMDFTGWRICRIGTKYMQGNKSVKNNLKLYLKSPEGVQQGTIYIDRLSFVSDVNYQNAPDAQLPENNEAQYVNHWNSLWKWESELQYDLPLRTLSAEQKSSLAKVVQGIQDFLPQSAQSSKISSAKTSFTSSKIRKEGDFLVGAPLVVDDDAGTGDLTFATLGTILYGLAQDVYFNQSEESKEKFMLAWDFAKSQGFDYGSSMGNNHHYGYQTREIFLGMYLMREPLKTAGKLDEAVEALSYWSGLPESRAVYDNTRDAIVDTWNTLLFARIISAAMMNDESQRYRAVESLVRWLDGSLLSTPGNVGGLKPDGTIFHHGGHYPAYGIGGFSGLGSFFASINESDFKISVESRKNLANSLLTMSNYTNFKDWSNGVSGRHPLSGSISQDVVNAYGYLALAGGIENQAETVDSRVGAEYLRLETGSNALKTKILNAGITSATTPQGFYVLNHTCQGVHRYGESMVSIKGYNSDVWGSEIYTKDNRYGRYQSYGAVEIFNGGSSVSRTNSRFAESGWDWNRMPGTTTIHLPLDRLESPQTTTLMVRSDEDFAGASSLKNETGIFGMKLKERNNINNNYFTPDFVARKSVFIFGKRIICMGSNINNTNANYSTETTLFQNTIRNTSSEKIDFNGTMTTAYNMDKHSANGEVQIVSDIVGNYYRLAPNTDLYVKGGYQQSKHNKTKVQTEGNFVTAWINHGKAPVDAAYEYMIMLLPSAGELDQWKADPGYEVLQCDQEAHIVRDNPSKTTAYVCFNETKPLEGHLLQCTDETLVLMQEEASNQLIISVCDPSINLPVKVKNSEITTRVGEPKIKRLILKGNWRIQGTNEAVAIQYDSNNTIIDVECLLGEPVEFSLLTDATGLGTVEKPELDVFTFDGRVVINGSTSGVAVYTIDGRLLVSQQGIATQRTLQLEKSQVYLLVANIPGNNDFHQIIIL